MTRWLITNRGFADPGGTGRAGRVNQRVTAANARRVLIQMDYVPPSTRATRVNRLQHALAVIEEVFAAGAPICAGTPNLPHGGMDVRYLRGIRPYVLC